MRKKASTYRVLWLVGSGAWLAIGAHLAVAQQTTDLVVQADRTALTVKRIAPGSPVHLVSMARRVSTGDLKLGTPAGAAELRKRVGDAAAAVCKQLDELYPDSKPSGRSCTDSTVKQAMRTIRRAAESS